MNEEHSPKMSPLSRSISQDGASVQIDIYEDGTGKWLLEVVDEYNNSTVWDDPFETEQSALDEAIKTINDDGIFSFVGRPSNGAVR